MPIAKGNYLSEIETKCITNQKAKINSVTWKKITTKTRRDEGKQKTLGYPMLLSALVVKHTI